ncbi:MAG TPA: nitroreductase family protein [Acidimicrobiales bacterium]|nr:nitroreductase family protein [Acidimicrobiales bacterium]
MPDDRPAAGRSPGGEGPAERPSEVAGAGEAARDPGFFEVVLAQRACRRFADRPVDEALLERCLEAAVHAPSAENRQPWVFVVVRDPPTRAAVADLTRRAWREGGRLHSEGRLPARLLAEVDEGAESGLAGAPVVVVVGGDASLAVEATLPSSVFPAVQNLLLAATALGLGSAMTTLATAFSDDLRELLGLPASVRPMAVVPLGWPARPLGPPRRLPLSERAHRDRYGRPW